MGSLLWYVIGITVFSLSAGAGNESPQTFTLDGQLYAADRTSPLIDAAAKIKVQILDPSRTCVLYEEEQPVDTTASGGHFTIQVGSIVGSTKRKSGDSGNTMQKVYQNTSAIPATGASCTGLYSPVMGAIRYVRVIVTPTAGSANTLSPDMVMDAVPNAMVAQSVQGLERENILQTNPAASLTQTKIEQFFMSLTSGAGSSVKFDGTNFVAYDPNNGSSLTPGTVSDAAIGSVGWAKITSVPPAIAAVAGLSCADGKILKMVSGSWACASESGVGSESDPTVAAYAKNAPGAGLAVSGGAIVADFGTGAGKVVQGNDSRLSDSRAPNGSAGGDLSGSYPSPTVAKIQGRGVSVTAPVDGQVLRYDNGASLWVPTNFGIDDLKTSIGTSQFVSASCLASQTLIWSAVNDTFSCTNISLPASQVTGALPFSQVSGTVPIAQGGTGQTTATASLNALLPSQSGANGKVLQSDGTNASWQTPAASGLTSFNGSSQASQTLATPGATGTAPNWSTNTGTGEHTLNIPMASATSVTAGLISKTDYDNFNSKLGSESDPKVGANTTNYLSKWNGSALVASTVIESGGLVGIGSATPITDVDIRNVQNGASGLRVYNNSASTAAKGRIIFDNGTSSAGLGHNGTGYTSTGGYQPNSSYLDSTGANGISVIAANAAGTVRLYTGGSANANERLRIDASGNVAIGTTTATTKLDVNGTINATAMTINGVPVGTATGVTSLNGSSQATQTFANGTSGTAPAFSTVAGTGVHTLNIPMANTASVTAGLISKTEYDSFNNKVGTGYSLAGDVTGTPAATVVDRIKGVAVSGAPFSTGQILRYNGSQLQPAFLSMFDLRSTITGAQAFGGVGCLSNQTLTWTAATDNLACTNISLPAGQVTGTLPIANGGTGATTADAAAAALLPSQSSNSGKFLTTDGTNLSWADAGTSGSNNSVVTGWPDAIACSGSSGNVVLSYSYQNPTNTGYVAGYTTSAGGDNLAVIFSTSTKTQNASSNSTGNFANTYTTCVGKTIAQLYASGQAFNFAKGPAGQWLQSGSNVYFNGGNVGVGTTSPSSALDVNGEARVGNRLAMANDGSSGAGVGVSWLTARGTDGEPNNLAYGYKSSATGSVSELYMRTAGTERVRIDSSGNVGINTTAPQAALAVNGGIENNANGEARHYRSVADKYLGAGVQTGTLKIKMPKTWSNTMMVVTIRGYDYTMNGGWEVVVSGYNYATTPSWINYSAEVRGTPPFTSVRLAHDGATNVILLGTTTTTWNYASVVVTDMIAHYAGSTGWGSGWTLSLITSEAGITNIVTPTIGQAWQTPTMQNGWVDYGSGYSPAGYMKESNSMVTLRGLVKSGTGGVCIFTLPAGYRPAYRGLFTTQASGSYARIDVLTDGCVNAYSSSTTWTSLEGIRFRAEQ